MKYSKKERLQIGREIYLKEITANKAAKKYQINRYTERDYMRKYRDEHHLDPTSAGSKELHILKEVHRKRYAYLEEISKEQ